MVSGENANIGGARQGQDDQNDRNGDQIVERNNSDDALPVELGRARRLAGGRVAHHKPADGKEDINASRAYSEIKALSLGQRKLPCKVKDDNRKCGERSEILNAEDCRLLAATRYRILIKPCTHEHRTRKGQGHANDGRRPEGGRKRARPAG